MKKKRVLYSYFQSLVYNESKKIRYNIRKEKKITFRQPKERGVNYFHNKKQQSINGVGPLNKEVKMLYMWLAQ